MPEDQGSGSEDGAESDRTRLIANLYEVVLHPAHYDSFMVDWSDFVDRLARELGEVQVTDGQASRHLDDPLIEAHFRRAFALFERMGRGEAVAASATAGREPLVCLGRGGVVLRAQPEAAALFGGTPTLHGIRAALEPESALRLTAFLAAHERAPALGRFSVLSLSDPPTNLSGDLPGGGLLAITAERDAESGAFVAQIRLMAIAWSPALSAILRESFRLTPREIGLVHELARGGDLPTIALRVGRSLNTLRAQLKSVFAKTRTGAQAELMRLVAVLMLHGADSGDYKVASAAAGDAIGVDLGDGRDLRILLLGPADGLPVIFVHGMLDGLAALAGCVPALRTSNLRLIAPMRANFGSSYGDPRIREAPDLFARDLAAVMAALGIGRAVVLGHMAGAIYAHAAAARLGAAVAGVASIAGAVPIRSIGQFATMPPRQRALAYTARFAPALLPAVLRAGIAQIDSAGAERFVTPLYPPGTRDRAVIDGLGIAETILDGYRFSVAQGTGAFRTDAWHTTRDWSALVAAADCPVRMIHGALDPVVSLHSARAFAQAHARIELSVIEGEGQLLLYSRPEAVLAEVATFARACLCTP